MEYKVVPFTGTLNQQNETTNTVANQLEKIIEKYNNQGWEYVSLESVSTYIRPDTGCFGIGGKPGYFVGHQMIVFSKI